uniref:Uncharacterized protein LOC104210071 n=1 Tax=Nicotiana sylvestris TaxID=4096 RepID=A0A1U7ULU8_NICSY|nr:PREDICTED: uncharacterized protein LOC104210071 [Nicotiana sylvestris]
MEMKLKMLLLEPLSPSLFKSFGDEVEDAPARDSISEPVQILSDEDTTPRGSNESIRRLFVSGFESGEFGPVLDETPLSSSIPISSIPLTTTSISLPILSTHVSLSVLVPISAPTVPDLTPTAPIVFTSSTTPPSIVPPPSVQHTEAGSSSRGMAMRSVTLEVPANHSLLRNTVHSTLKANLIGTELMGRISTLEKKDRESAKAISEARRIAEETQLEAANWKEQFENAQGTIEELQESRNHLEQQKRGLTSELAIAKASSSQFEKDKELLECSFSEQLSKASEEIRELKALVEKKEEYAGELVQSLTQAQADLRISSDEIHALKTTQENFDLQSELAKVLDTIEKNQQPVDTPSSALGTPGAEELLNEESMEAEAPVALASLGDFNTPGPVETALIAAPSEVVTVPVTAPENEIATFDVPTPSVTS